MHDHSTTTDQDGGRTITGRYRLDEYIGDGGTSKVFRGRDLFLDRTVAIKQLSAPALRGPSRASTFQNEAHVSATLAHPGIVTLYDAVEEEEDRYLIMEYVDGATLRRHLVDGPLQTAAAVDLVVRISEALEYAHSHDVVHGDVKPDNILVAVDGRPRLFDFGVARLLTDADAVRVMPVTAAYAAPEVLSGGAPTPVSDVYSLGLLLRELLTGILPGEEHKPEAEVTPPAAPPRKVPTQLEAIVTRATDQDPLRRYQSAKDFLKDLTAYQHGESISFRNTSGISLLPLVLRLDTSMAQRLVLALPLVLGIFAAIFTFNALERAAIGYEWTDAVSDASAATDPETVQLPSVLLEPWETVTPESGPATPVAVVDRSTGPTSDPFQFCAIVGTTETPTQSEFGTVRYTGPAQPFTGKAWRCWNGMVLTCTGGSSASACMKVSTSRTASAALIEYCRSNPESEPPLSITGQTTAYDWSCQRGKPLVARQRISDQQIDGFGYRIGPWVTLTAP